VKDTIHDVIIPHLIAELSKREIGGLPDYEKRLRDNAGNREVFGDLFREANAALMFSNYGFEVSMRERPDLRVELDGGVVYAEVTHFREKKQDRIDKQAMGDSEDLVPVGILTPTEGSEAWDQLACKARRKANQYKDDAPNILVVETSSNSVDGSILATAVHRYNKWAASDKDLQMLNAFMLIDRWIGRAGCVHFCQTARVAISLSPKLCDALASIRYWSTPINLTSCQYKVQNRLEGF
jgi:hypothetical protein